MPPPTLMHSPAGMALPSMRHAGQAKPYRRLMQPAWQQFWLMLGIILVTDTLSRGSGVAGRAFFIVSAAAACIYYMRKSPWLYVTMSLWFWTVTPLARRLIDYHAGFDPVNYILGVPEFLSLLMVWSILNSRELMRLRETITGLFIAVPIMYGIGVSFVQGQVVSGVVGSADCIGPPLYYFYILANWRRIGELEPILTRFLGINISVVCLYAVFQFVAPPAWDTAWMINSGLPGVGSPDPFQIRVFSTLNQTGTLASWLSTSLLLFLHFKNRATPFLVPVAAVLVLLTFVRSAAGSVLVAYLVAALLGRGGIFKMLIIATMGVVLSLSVLSIVLPQMSELIAQRASSVEDLQHDTSANDRAYLYEQTPRAIAAAPFGIGIGAIGRGAVSKQDNDDLAVIDSGPLGIYLPLGWVMGTVYIVGLVLMVVQAWSAARLTRSQAAIALTAAAVAQVSLLPFYNVLGMAGLLLWFSAGYSACIGLEARTSRQIATRPVDRFAPLPAVGNDRAMP